MEAEAAVVGRERELAAIEAFLDVVAGGPASLRFSGAPGIGKTAIWSSAVASAAAAGVVVLAARPAEAELQLGFSVLGDLLGPVADALLPSLAAPLAAAVEGALLRAAPPATLDPHAVGRGVAAILSSLAAQGPVVVAIDDLQWVDPPSARAVGFAVRRVRGPFGVLATVRHSEGLEDVLHLHQAWGLRASTVEVGPLSPGATQHLVRRVAPALSRRAVQRIQQQSGGNPFFAMELARSTATEDLPTSLAELVAQRLRALPVEAHGLVELVAALGSTPLGVLARVAAGSDSALDACVRAEVLTIDDGNVWFTHPLLATGAYASTSPMRRRALHRLGADLAQGLEQRARHIALATDATDETGARLLADAAVAAQRRGAPESAADLAAHAVRLTPATDLAELAEREMLLADLLYLAGDDATASSVTDEVLAMDVHGVVRARALIHRVQHDESPSIAVCRLEQAVVEAADDEVVRARALAALAWMRGVWGGDLDPASEEAAMAVELAERTGDAPVLTTALTTAGIIATYRADDRARAYFTRALAVTDGVEWVAGDRLPYVAFAHERFFWGDFDAATSLLGQERELAERSGEESRLERLNVFRADLEIRRGGWEEADRLLGEALAWADAGYWRTRALLFRSLLNAKRGAHAALQDVAEAEAAMVGHDDAILEATARYCQGLVALAHGQPQEAAERLGALPAMVAASGQRHPGILMITPDAVEALVDSGDAIAAAGLTDDLEARCPTGHPVGLAAVSRCRGLLALGGDTAAALHHLEGARARFEDLPAPYDVGRTQLIEGVALRRAGQRAAAAGALRSAGAIFTALGAHRWRERADDELRRAQPRTRSDADLTAAERGVARLVVMGRTNREVAAQLYTTVATVEAHLTRIYRKLQIRSRTELARAVSEKRVVLDDP